MRCWRNRVAIACAFHPLARNPHAASKNFAEGRQTGEELGPAGFIVLLEMGGQLQGLVAVE
jgi:hypothetical protein